MTENDHEEASRLTRDGGPAAEAASVDSELRRVLRNFIGRRVGDREIAEDLTQEVLLKVHRAGGDVDGIEDVAAWIYRIARNTLVDHYRSTTRQPLPDMLPVDLVAVDEVVDNAAVRELANCLRPLIANLDPIYRDALTLVELEGLSQTAAAERTGISVSGMKSRVQRARTQLKTAVTECCVVHMDPAGRIHDYDAPPHCCS